MKLIIYDIIGVNTKQDWMVVPGMLFAIYLILYLNIWYLMPLVFLYVFISLSFNLGKKAQMWILKIHSNWYSKDYKILMLENCRGFEINKNGINTVFESKLNFIPTNDYRYFFYKLEGLEEYCFENKIKYEEVRMYLEEAYLLSPRLRGP